MTYGDIDMENNIIHVTKSVEHINNCHIFKKETSITLMSYKNYIKIERAKELLKTGDMKIGDIANKCGYENSSYFSETFKKTEKISPSAYRDLMRNT